MLQLPPQAYKSYQVVAPLSTHWREAKGCADAECGNYLNGWLTVIDERTELGQRQADYIRKQSGRKFSEERLDTGLTRFTFEPGQQCFQSDKHRVRLEREERYFIRDGDSREFTRTVEVKGLDDWQEDFAEHQDFLIEIQRREGLI